ncbi:hypothetical protein D3C78_927830 [compost metagenome]
MCTSIPGQVARYCCNIIGSSLIEEVGPKEPMRSVPRFMPRASAASWRKVLARPSMARARSSNGWPMSLSSTRDGCLLSNSTPNSCSSDLMAWDTADWLMPRRLAALVKLCSSATRENISSWVSVMSLYSFYDD